jgi:hypothetical protein
VITSRDGKAETMGDRLAMSELSLAGQSACYEIRDGRVITTLLGVPFDVAIYKLGDKYIAARSNEFNYANYEIESVK